MSQILDMITSQLGQGGLQQLGRAIGASEQDAGNAVGAALPLLMGALARNAQTPDGAASLHDAVNRDHDGSVLDDVVGFIKQGGNASHGEGILRHALGDRRDVVAAGVGRAAGLDTSAVNKLLPMLAPLVMGALGRTQRATGASATSLAGLLAGEQEALQRTNPAIKGLAGLLDQDGDGQIADDIAAAGKNLLGRLFRS